MPDPFVQESVRKHFQIQAGVERGRDTHQIVSGCPGSVVHVAVIWLLLASAKLANKSPVTSPEIPRGDVNPTVIVQKDDIVMRMAPVMIKMNASLIVNITSIVIRMAPVGRILTVVVNL